MSPARPDEDKGGQPTENRVIEVADPRLSDVTNANLTDEVRDVIGSTQVEVPAHRRRPSHGEEVTYKRSLPLPFSLPDNFALAQTGAALTVIAAIVVLALVVQRWWTLALAVLVLFAVTYTVVATIIKMTGNPERPSADVVAAMEEEGLHDPEQFFSDVIDEFTPDTGVEQQNTRTTAVEEDPARAAAEQRDATTPSGGPSRPVGPGS